MAEEAIYQWIGKADFLFITNLIYTELSKYAKAASLDSLTPLLTFNTFKTEVESALDDKVDKEVNMGLSHEDFTTALKNKLNSFEVTDFATPAQVEAAIKEALKDVTGIKFDGPYGSYAEMVIAVTDPKQGTIYLVNNGEVAPNSQDEYFWNGTTFEKFGSTSVDLSGYVKKEEMEELSTTEIKAIWDSVFE